MCGCFPARQLSRAQEFSEWSSSSKHATRPPHGLDCDLNEAMNGADKSLVRVLTKNLKKLTWQILVTTFKLGEEKNESVARYREGTQQAYILEDLVSDLKCDKSAVNSF